ncbi:MAG: hypothetical protein ACI808_001756 [Paraglaciecola sp.]|jgi:hypothetical protein
MIPNQLHLPSVILPMCSIPMQFETPAETRSLRLHGYSIVIIDKPNRYSQIAEISKADYF